MKTLFLLVILILAASVALVAPNPQNLVPFVLPWDDSTPGPTDISQLLHKPAGKYGFIRPRNGHLYASNQRVRFFGVNFTNTACFPEHADAEKIAARMAKFGINCVRFHHMDAMWQNDVIFENDKRTISPERLEKLDYFIYQLKKHGVYSNINLHVTREYPGMPRYDGRPGFDKGLDIFYPPMITLQKEYARDLLTHRNPYTKTRYIDEPAVAIVEINNENGLVWTWVTRGLDGMSKDYSNVLDGLWNEWLRIKYRSDEKLRKAWQGESKPLGQEMISNSDFKAGEDGWLVEEFAPDASSLGFESDPAVGKFARMRVAKTDGTAWHVQLHHPGLALSKNKTYTLTLKARADRNLRLGVAAQQHGEPWAVVWSSQFEVGQEWIERRLVVKPDRDDSRLRVSFSTLGAQPLTLDLALVSLREGVQYQDLSGKLGEFGFVRRVDVDRISPATTRDWLEFMCDIETGYWTEMRDYIVKQLKSKSLIVGTASPFSPTGVQAKLDVVDAHSYWQHPQFPGAAWDGANWIVGNESMAGTPGGGTLGEIGSQRAFGKPFIVTEYNHSAPNTYSSEGFPLLAMYACLQDWDGIFAFDYLSSKDYIQADKINGFFDIAHHPTKMTSLVAAAAMFLRGDVRPIKERRSVSIRPADWSYMLLNGNPWSLGSTMGFRNAEPMRYRVGQDVLSGKERLGISPSLKSGNPEAANPTIYRAGGMVWDTVKQSVTLTNPRSQFFIGRTDGESVKLGDVSLQITGSLQNWAAITTTRLNNSTLITATGYAQNTGMVWNNDQMNSVGANWGTSPSLVECISARVTVPAGGGVQVWSLDERGQRATQVPVVVKSGRAAFSIGPEYKTLWYEVKTAK